MAAQPWGPHWALPHGWSSQRLPKTSRSSFSISRTKQPQSTKLSLEGVSKSKGIWISLWAPQHIKSLMLCKKLVYSSGTELPCAKAVWNNKLERNSLYCETPDIFDIYIFWPQISALHPFSQALSLAGAQHTVALMCRARQLPKHGGTERPGASEHANLPASRHHQEQQPAGTGSMELCSFTAIQGCFIHFFISIPP